MNLIANTTTRTGLRVHAESDHGYYPTGTVITDEQLAAIPLTGHDFHPEWNYDITPTRPRKRTQTTRV